MGNVRNMSQCIPSEAQIDPIIVMISFQCSRAVCDPDPEENEETIEEWLDNWKLFPEGGLLWRSCHYNPSNHDEVLTVINYTAADVFHGLFWPLFGIVGILLTMAVFALNFRCGTPKSERSNARGRQQTSARTSASRNTPVSYNAQNNLVVIDGDGRHRYPPTISHTVAPLAALPPYTPQALDNPAMVPDDPIPPYTPQEMDNPAMTPDNPTQPGLHVNNEAGPLPEKDSSVLNTEHCESTLGKM